MTTTQTTLTKSRISDTDIAADATLEAGSPPLDPDGTDRAGEFAVRASFPLHGIIAAGAAVVAIGFAWSAAAGAGGLAGSLRWTAAAVFTVLAVVAVRALIAQPLLVADDTGIRLRIQADWIGTPWEDIESVTVLPRRHLLDDGRIAVHLQDPGPVLASVSSAVRKQTDANRRVTGSSLAVPFGLAAKPSGVDVVDALRHFADGRCPVTEQL